MENLALTMTRLVTPLGGSMTTLYRPVLIKTAEQAEALPVSTLVLRTQSPYVIKHEDGAWRYAQGSGGALSKMLVGDTALVPVEAKEETAEEKPEIVECSVEKFDAYFGRNAGRYCDHCGIHGSHHTERHNDYANLVLSHLKD